MYALQTPLQARHPLRIVRSAFLAFLITAGVTSGTADAQKAPAPASKPAGVAKSGPTTVIMFDMKVGGTYSIKKNGADLSNVDAGPFGVLRFHDVTSTGDIFQIMWTGDNPVQPTTPTGLSASGTDVGCANISWDTPDPAEYVYEYVLAWGPSPGTFTDSTVVNTSSVSSQGGTSTYIHCGLLDGRYCFAIRAHNLYDMWSAYTPQSCADVSNGNTQGPPPPQGVAVSQTDIGCATVTWNALSDPSVTGYTVYYGQQSSTYTDSVDAGMATSKEICDLTEGTHYFAVKSYTGAGIKSAYSAERSLAMEGADDTPPTVSAMNPFDGETGVELNRSIRFTVADDKSGVSQNSVTVTVNGTTVSNLGFVGTPASFDVVATPDSDLPANSTVNVSVTVSDLASPANSHTEAWSFETGDVTIVDNDPPVFSGMSPADGATDVAADVRDIRVNVADDGMGVDMSTIEFYVNGGAVAYSTQGTSANLTLVYENTGGFAPNATVTVRVVASDLASPANRDEVTFTFTVKSDVANVSPNGMGEIVPNGFWANDPTRPLEVRNLPVSWTVRIFDTAGGSVRDHTNTATDGADWMWDFTNDHGQRVARALYLVRVTDPNGKVHQSGRFLVQSDP